MIRFLHDKFFLLLFGLLIFNISVFAQSSVEEYYQSASGKSGNELKTALNLIIRNHTELPYSSSDYDVWDALKETDEDPSNPNNVILIYTGRSEPKTHQDNGSGDENSWNREHIWAKSHGNFGSKPGAGTDIHHLRACDKSVNSDRSNKFFDNGGSPHSEATECNADNDSWEPRDAVKGDVARMIFYMAVRYEGENDEPDLELTDDMSLSTVYNTEAFFGKKSTLLKWHRQDPVSEAEKARNEKVYSIQKNRNPFIDHPEYVGYIWQGETPQAIELISVAPLNNASNVEINAELTMTFSTTVAAGEGYVTVYNKADNSVFESIKTSNSNLVNFQGNLVRILPDKNLNNESTYYIKVDADAFTNSNGDYYKGIDNSYSWAFSTGKLVNDPLEIVSHTPAGNAQNVSVTAEFSIEFNRDVYAGNYGFKLYDSNDELIQYLAATNSNVIFNGNTIHIALDNELKPGESYYVLIDPAAVKDAEDTYFKGISDKSKWTFSTDQATGINENGLTEEKPGFYPNPTDGTIYLTNQNQVDKIKIINLTGKTILEENFHMNSISLSRFPPGMYILTFILNNGEHVSKKLIKK